MNVTINDIARATGLSTATISKYINHKKIREENRILIEKAIQELGYTPNRNAQLLRAKNTHTIGILISDLGNYFWGELVNSIIKHFTDHGYTVIVCSFFFEHQKEIDTIQDIISQHFDGVIMLPSCWHDDLYQLLQNAGIPVVMLDQIPASMRHFPVDCVISDNYRGGALLAEHLLEKGHTKVWIMEQYLDSYTIEQRIQGFVDVYQKNGIDLLKQQDSFPPVSFGSTAETITQSNLHFQKLIDSSDPPTAVFFDCYLSAMGGLSAAGGMMRFVGFAVLLKIMLSNDLWGWLLGGFATALLFGNVEATASACLILVAFIGVAIALLDFKITSIETKAAQGGVSDGI